MCRQTLAEFCDESGRLRLAATTDRVQLGELLPTTITCDHLDMTRDRKIRTSTYSTIWT